MKILKEKVRTRSQEGACPLLRSGSGSAFVRAPRVALAEREGRAFTKRRITFPVNEETDKTAGKNAIERRRERYALREFLWDISSLERVRKCGRVPIAPLVALRGEKGGKVGFSGLARCGSPHSCPVCSSRIQVERARELEKIIEYAQGKGWFVSMLTLTIRHNKGHRLSDLYDGLISGWHSVTSGRRWLEFKEQIGLKHWVKSIEITISRDSGFHAHQHILVLSEKNPEVTPYIWQRKQGRAKKPYPVQVMRSQDFIAEQYQKGLAKLGLDFLQSKGMDWTTAKNAQAMGRYVAKMQGQGNLALEMSLGGMKKTRATSSRTPFQVLADCMTEGEAEDFAIWREIEQATRNRRSITFSKGLKDEVGIEERTDEEIVEDEVGDDVVLTLSHKSWRKTLEHGAVYLLEALQTGGTYTAMRWCDERGIEWKPPEGKSRDP